MKILYLDDIKLQIKKIRSGLYSYESFHYVNVEFIYKYNTDVNHLNYTDFRNVPPVLFHYGNRKATLIIEKCFEFYNIPKEINTEEYIKSKVLHEIIYNNRSFEFKEKFNFLNSNFNSNFNGSMLYTMKNTFKIGIRRI